MYRKKILSLAIGLSLSAISHPVYSLGIGNPPTTAILNRPLDIELPLIAESFELFDLHASLADDMQHERFGLLFPAWMPKLKFETINTQSGPKLKITSYQAIKEPIVNFVLQVKYKDVLIYKEITLLLDPIEKFNTADAVVKQTNRVNNQIITSVNVSSPNRNVSNQQQTLTNQTNTDFSFRVTRGQNLWNIAKNWSVENTTLQQKMQAIFLSNPEAFINGDINKLKQGSILNLNINALNLRTNGQTNNTTTETSLTNQTTNEVTNSETKGLNNISSNNNASVDMDNIENANIDTSLDKTPNETQSTVLVENTTLSNTQTDNQNIEQEINQLNATIEQQVLLNAALKAELDRLEQQIELQTKYNNLSQQINSSENSINTANDQITSNKPLANTPINLSANDNPANNQAGANETSSPINIWLTSIWFAIALILAYLGTIISGKRSAKKFAQKLDHKLQDMAYNQQKQRSDAPSIKELSIPQNLSPSVQIKYLNSAADFYIRCHRHDLAKELVNEGLIQFRGNPQIIETLNQIRSRIFNQLDNDIHAHIVEKLDHRKSETKPHNDNIIDIDEFNDQWLKEWDKKVS